MLVVALASQSFAAWTCNGCSADNIAVIGDATVTGSNSTIHHASILGNFTVNGSLTGIELKNSVIVGTPTLGSNVTTDQWATTGTVGGAGTPSEAVISLPASPFNSTTDLRPKPGTLLINNGVTLSGHATDIMGHAMQGSAWDIGAYEFVFGGGMGQQQHGFEMY